MTCIVFIVIIQPHEIFKENRLWTMLLEAIRNPSGGDCSNLSWATNYADSSIYPYSHRIESRYSRTWIVRGLYSITLGKMSNYEPPAGYIQLQQAAVQDCCGGLTDCWGFYFKQHHFSNQLYRPVDKLQLSGKVVPFKVKITASSYVAHPSLDNPLWIQWVVNYVDVNDLGSTVLLKEWHTKEEKNFT